MDQSDSRWCSSHTGCPGNLHTVHDNYIKFLSMPTPHVHALNARLTWTRATVSWCSSHTGCPGNLHTVHDNYTQFPSVPTPHPVNMPDPIRILSGSAREHRTEAGRMILVHRLASGLDPFSTAYMRQTSFLVKTYMNQSSFLVKPTWANHRF